MWVIRPRPAPLAKDFKELLRDFELEYIRIRTYRPESNGRIERFHRSTGEALTTRT